MTCDPAGNLRYRKHTIVERRRSDLTTAYMAKNITKPKREASRVMVFIFVVGFRRGGLVHGLRPGGVPPTCR